MVDQIVQWLTNLIQTIGYPGVALSMFIESFFAPIPSELILPFAGFIAASGKFNIVILIIVASISSYMGTLPFYFIGFYGRDYVTNFMQKYSKYLFIDANAFEKAFDLFEKKGEWTILVGRVVPIVRSLISFPAGVSKINFLRFSILTLLGATVWSSLLIIAGYFLGESWEKVSDYVAKYEYIVLILGVIGIVLFVGYNIRNIIKATRKSNTTNS